MNTPKSIRLKPEHFIVIRPNSQYNLNTNPLSSVLDLRKYLNIIEDERFIYEESELDIDIESVLTINDLCNSNSNKLFTKKTVDESNELSEVKKLKIQIFKKQYFSLTNPLILINVKNLKKKVELPIIIIL